MLDPKGLRPGESQVEAYYSQVSRKVLVQYDYRDHDGVLFSTVAGSYEEAIRRRDIWLKEKNRPVFGDSSENHEDDTPGLD
ncbi:MAG: DUF3873 family protein [Deltaproteobacteria bacterium]|nr:DUF3873 family protein [Deltaproteobacteria bacterium]